MAKPNPTPVLRGNAVEGRPREASPFRPVALPAVAAAMRASARPLRRQPEPREVLPILREAALAD